MKRFLFLLLVPATLFSCAHQEKEPAAWVDPFSGTGGKIGVGHGNTFPGAAWPFGMIQLSPDNGRQGWEYCAGYHYPDSFIVGFSHTHLSGTGVGDLADISLMPTTRKIRREYFEQSPAFVKKYLSAHHIPPRSFLNRDGMQDTFQYNYLLAYRDRFSHRDEEASPGYYRVQLTDNNIRVELTASEFVGMHRYTFPDTAHHHNLILNLGFHINRDRPVQCLIKQVNDTLLTGYRFSEGWADNQHVFFAMAFSQPVTSIRYFLADRAVTDSYRGQRLAAGISFDSTANPVLLVRTAISSANTAGALANLHTADTFGWDFDALHAATRRKWNEELGKIQVSGGSPRHLTTFYTALYHSFLAPYRYSDITGTWKNYLGRVDTARGYVQYTVLSLWDIFRAEAPLLLLTQPRLYNNIIKSMLAMYRQTGSLPYWEIEGSEGGSMIGYHAVVLIADAILKNVGDFDREEAFEAMKAIANTDRKGLGWYRQYHFVPTDKERSGTVSKTIEFAYDDWCIAQVAQKLGHRQDYATYLARSQYWKNVFDSTLHIMRGRNSDGSWYEPFIPRFAQYGNPLCVEGDIWQYTFFVPQDMEGLIAAMGGPAGFEKMLDSLFTQNSELLGEDTEDVTGMVGQYAQGNEPSHHVAYLYDLIGKEWKTQYYVHKIADSLYFPGPRGLCGNEDCGQMSAWYVFSAMGFYPVNPVDGRYRLGSPLFRETQLHLPGGHIFTVKAPHLSDKNIYIRSKKLNGRPLHRSWITWQELTAGGFLELEMTANPQQTP